MDNPFVVPPLFVRRVDQHQGTPRWWWQQRLERGKSVGLLNHHPFAESLEILPQTNHLPAVQFEQPQTVLLTHRR
jgi:hypothetical protein